MVKILNSYQQRFQKKTFVLNKRQMKEEIAKQKADRKLENPQYNNYYQVYD